MSNRARATLVASLIEPFDGQPGTRLAEGADILEVRADRVGDLDLDRLRAAFDGELLYTLRSRAEGGAGADAAAERRPRLIAAAAAGYDLVDLEAARDLAPEVLEAVPPAGRLISWHGRELELEPLRERLETLSAVDARWYKMAIEAPAPGAALAPLALLKSVERDDLVAFATGRAGTWTRLLAPRLGAPLVFGSVGEAPAAPGQPSIERLTRDYGLPNLPPLDRLYGIVGLPVDHSLSPRLHNRLYRELGLPALYLPFHVETFGDFWLDLVESGSLDFLGFPLAGLSVTAPFKEIAQAVAGASSPLAERIGSANTLVRRGGVWEAESTDPEGVVGPARSREFALAGRRAAVVGSGGAGRAAAFGLARAGARVTLVNRGCERGRRVARELGLDFEPFDGFDSSRFDVLVNATPLGRTDDAPLPFEPRTLAAGSLVIDLAYLDGRPTRLVERARAEGLEAVDGREVLLCQAAPQFLSMTGERLDEGLARRVLGLEDKK